MIKAENSFFPLTTTKHLSLLINNISRNESLFVFGEEEADITSKDSVLRLPLGIKDKATLLSAYAEAGRFPEYFGYNWDALSDCLCDFSWVSQKRVIIVHSDIPLLKDSEELSLYLSILANAIRIWKSEIEHQLIVVFPVGVMTCVDIVKASS